MAQTILLKRSALPGKTPDTGSLQLGEIAINTYDGKMYLKRSGSVESIEAIVTTGAEITGSLSILNGITGSLYGTASFAVTASFAQNIHPNVTASYAVSASQALNSDNAISSSYALEATNALTASYFVTSSVTSASYAENADLLDGYDSAAFVLSSSYNQFTSSYYIDSASFSSSIAELQDFSSSLDATFATDAELNAATASLSASISYLSSSYLDSSSSFDTRILANSSSIGILSSSLMAFTASYNTGSFTGSFKGSFTGSLFGTSSYALEALSSSYALSASQAINANNALTSSYSLNINGSTNHIPLFDSPNSLVTSAIYQSNSYSVIINQDNNTSAAPEALYVWQPSTSSYNVISGKGNLDNYLQLNIQNTNNGVNASSDVVATANNGNESTNYIDMGINNENYNSGFIGEANDAYLYSTGRHLHIGNVSNFPVQIFAGGSDSDANRKLEIRPDNQHQLTGSLDISGSLIVQDGITGSLFGTASFAITASYAANVPETASFAISASQAQNANNAVSSSYALTASYAANVPETASFAISASQAENANNALNATSASYAATSSYADNFTVAGTLTAQTINVQTITSSIDYVTGSTIFGSELSNTHQFTGSVTITGSLAVNNSNVILTNQTSSMSVLSASYALTASYASNVPETASFAISASQAQNANTAISASYALDATNAITASYVLNAVSASQAQNANTATSASYALQSTNAITASYVQTAQTASYVLNAISSSYALSASYAYNADLLDGKDSSEFATTGSNTFIGKETISGSIRFAISNDPDLTGVENTTYLFASASNTSLGQDLYFRQNGNLVKWKWIEGQLSSGLLYGGVVTYSSSFVYVSSGSGIIVNYNAVTGSEIAPIIDYVTWGPITASITDITSSQVTYLYIDSNGALQQQPFLFTSEQFEQSIPLGAVGHFNYTDVQSFGGDVNTAYGQQTQTNVFIDAFGPMKLNGYILTPQTNTLHLNVGSGTSFIHGGFYEQNPDNPSTLTSNSQVTASIVRCYTSGSETVFLDNTGSFFTTVDPTKWDDNGVLNTVNGANWSIQRVFSYPQTNTLYVYYGQSEYTTFTNALQYLASDPFVEGLATQPFTIFVGYLILRGNTTNLADTNNNRIIQAGLYRSTVGGSTGGSAVTTTLEDLSDVTITSPVTGEALIYNAGTWINGYPTSASYALTASYASNVPETASYAISASQAITASYVQTAQTASYVLNAVSASYALSASYASNAGTATSSSYAATASYADNFTVKNTLTAQTLVVSTVSSSVVYSSGSNIFGNDLSNTQVFTGSVSITGSLAVNGTTATLGTGTVNTVPKFTAANIIGNSNITDSGTLITLGSLTRLTGAGTFSTDTTVDTGDAVLISSAGATPGTGAFGSGLVFGGVGISVNPRRAAIVPVMSTTSADTDRLGLAFFTHPSALGTDPMIEMMRLDPNGALGIGTTSLTARSLSVSRNLTGSTIGYNILSDGIIQSDVTSQAHYFTSVANTAAASFTLGTIYHYRAIQGTFGAGSTVSGQAGFWADASLIGATTNYGFFGNIPSGTNRYNLFMNGTAENYLAGNTGIGSADVYVNSGPILTTTLTNGGSGYVDGTYTDVAASAIAANGFFALFTIVVSGSIVTTATLTWGGSSYKVGQTLTVSNTLLGGTGSGLIITVATVDSSQLKITNANGGDITLFRLDNSVTTGDNIGTIKWEGLDSNAKGSGLYAEIGAFGAGTAGGAYLSFFTRAAAAGTSLVEAMRIGSEGGVGIGATTLTSYALRVSKNITGAVTSFGIVSDGIVQSDVTTQARGVYSNMGTAAASFTLTGLVHFRAEQGTIGVGSTVTSQVGYWAGAMNGSTNTQGFYGDVTPGANRWNLFMNSTANNYMAGALGIGTTTLTGYKLNLGGSITGAVTTFNINAGGTIQSDVTANHFQFQSSVSTAASAFTLGGLYHFRANQGTIGATSAITNQYGYVVESNLTGATNNYGFWGGISSGSTNNWNLYMIGGAPNFLSGSTGIGKTPSTGIKLDVSGSTLMTGSLNVTNGITGSLFGTASFATTASFAPNATSASYAATSSYADDFTIKNTFTFDATLNDYSSVASSISGTNNVFNRATGSYTSAFFKYTVRNTTNARTGEVMAVWNGANVEFTDFSTRDLGTTSAVTMSVSLAGGDIQFNAITNTSGWNVKAVATFM